MDSFFRALDNKINLNDDMSDVYKNIYDIVKKFNITDNKLIEIAEFYWGDINDKNINFNNNLYEFSESLRENRPLNKFELILTSCCSYLSRHRSECVQNNFSGYCLTKSYTNHCKQICQKCICFYNFK
jgi:hypothetical protein